MTRFSLPGFLGSGPNIGDSLVEWGEILYIHLYVSPHIRSSIPPGWRSDPSDWP